MRVFVTDNSSYIGKAIVDIFSAQQHEVVAPKTWLREEVLEQLASCEVILLDLLHNPDQSKNILEYLQIVTTDKDQMLVGISTVLTWNRTSTKPNYNPLAGNKTPVLSEQNYKKRKCSPRYRGIRQLESLVLSTQKDNLFSYVVAPGILYGREEESLHLLFRDAWLAQLPLKILSQGNNIIPTIHIDDMVNCLLQILYAPPTHTQYCVFVDASKTSQSEIVTHVSKKLGIDKTEYIARSDVDLQLLVQALSQEVPTLGTSVSDTATANTNNTLNTVSNDNLHETELLNANNLGACTTFAVPPCDGLSSVDPDIALLDVNFNLDGSVVASLPVEWHAPGGIINTFDKIVTEYLNARGLQPLRILLSGGPAVGKSYYSKIIASRYKLPIVTVGEALKVAAQGSGLLADTIRSYQHDLSENEGKKKSTQHATQRKGGNMGKNGKNNVNQSTVADTYLTDRLPDNVVCEAVRRMLLQPSARNHGYVLDGFPLSENEFKLLFKNKKSVNTYDQDIDNDMDANDKNAEDNSWANEDNDSDNEDDGVEENENNEDEHEEREKEQFLAMLRDEEADARAEAELDGVQNVLPLGVNLIRKAGVKIGKGVNKRFDPTVAPSHVVLFDLPQEAAITLSRERNDLNTFIPRHNDEEGIRRRWVRYELIRSREMLCNSAPVDILEIGTSTALLPDTCSRVLETYISRTRPDGPGYFSTPQDYVIQQEARERRIREAQEKAHNEQNAKVKAMSAERARREDMAVQMRQRARNEESKLVEAAALPLRQFLLKNVISELVDGLVDVLNCQPADPVEHIAEYLFKVAVNSSSSGYTAHKE